MVLRFDWLDGELPARPWAPDMRTALCAAIGQAGSRAVQEGEFGPLERLYRDFTTIFPRLLVDASDVDRAALLYALLYTMLWRRTQKLAELKCFNADVVAPFTAYLSRHFSKTEPVPSNRAVPRVAYLSETSDLFGSNAIARITVSLMLGQQELRDPADWPILYCINRPADCLLGFAEEHGLQLRDLARETPSLTAEAVIAWSRENMSAYKAPRFVEFRDALPMTGAGKVLRRLLKS